MFPRFEVWCLKHNRSHHHHPQPQVVDSRYLKSLYLSQIFLKAPFCGLERKVGYDCRCSPVEAMGYENLRENSLPQAEQSKVFTKHPNKQSKKPTLGTEVASTPCPLWADEHQVGSRPSLSSTEVSGALQAGVDDQESPPQDSWLFLTNVSLV